MKSFIFYSIMAIMLQLLSNSLVFGEGEEEEKPYLMVINSNNASNDRKALAQVHLEAPYEYECEIESVDKQIKNYQGFIRQFPNSEFIPEALVNIAWLDLYSLQCELSPKETKSRLARARVCYKELFDKNSNTIWGKTAKELYDVLLKDARSIEGIGCPKIDELHDRLSEEIPLCTKLDPASLPATASVNTMVQTPTVIVTQTGELSRAEAQKQLQNYKDFLTSRFLEVVYITTEYFHTNPHTFVIGHDTDDRRRNIALAQKLKKDGYVTIENHYFYLGPNGRDARQISYKLSPTEKLNPFITFPMGYDTRYIIKAYEIFAEITGVLTISDNEAKVEYRTKIVPTEMAEYFPLNEGELKLKSEIKVAYFAKYDDGWRLLEPIPQR